MAMRRRVSLFIATSLDGYIADSNGGISFLDLVKADGEDYGYSDFFNTTDTVVLGRKTWDTLRTMGIKNPYADKEVFVISRSKAGKSGKVTYTGLDPCALVEQLRCIPGKGIYIDGGAETVNTLIRKKLIGHIVISVIPVILGGGIRLFGEGNPLQNLKLINSTSFPSGLVQLEYVVERPG